MTNKRIRVTIPAAGLGSNKTSVKVEALNFQGSGCSTAARKIAEALGSCEQEDTKEEYYAEEALNNTNVNET